MGGSLIELSAVCESCNIVSSGGSVIKGNDLICDTAKVDVSGGGILMFTVNKSLTGENSGGSKILYKGNPVINVNNSGGSSVNSY